MLVITSITGDSLRKEPSLSSASATRNSPSPSLALLPKPCTLPPTTTVGSRPASARMVATMEVVEVLPWLPATAMPYFFSRISSASISARWMTGMCCSRAATTSGLSAAMAVEVTTTSAPATQGAS